MKENKFIISKLETSTFHIVWQRVGLGDGSQKLIQSITLTIRPLGSFPVDNIISNEITQTLPIANAKYNSTLLKR